MLVGLENSALLPPRIMLRVHYTIRKEQRFGKGKADDQGRQLVSISAIPTPQSLTPFVRSVLSPLGGDKRNSSRDSAELPFDQAVNPICSDFQPTLSRQTRRRLRIRRIPDATACLSPFPFVAPFSRQSHFNLRNDALRASVASCLKIGQVNRSPLPD